MHVSLFIKTRSPRTCMHALTFQRSVRMCV